MMVEQHGISPMIEKPKRKNSDTPQRQLGCKLPCYWFFVIFGLCACVSGYIYIEVGRAIFGPPILTDQCEVELSDLVHFRISAFTCDLCGDPRHYEISRDGGATWEKIYTYLNNDAEVFADCGEFQVVNDTHYLFNIQDLRPYGEHRYIVGRLSTNDRGVTWR
jgi:hypothetical protein